ncbi:UNVERIFIED_CONTAM: Activating signal cointegrator 1 [Sesamum radiatum]|uniref:Activating signal cointegrator 1 n=1 Tax=Sesamum radiatum TaxID=300843 RepID=A0AAW2SJN5_SESRA
MASRRRVESSNYRNPCLTMHQPWASLLVYGIKRVEGRSWPAPVRGRLWIHAASKIPEPETIRAMEDFYREIYAMNGITDVKFPEHYPVSRLLGCVDVVGCVTCEELVNWEELPASVRIEGQTAFCWLCEQPQKLIIPFEMRGYQGVYNLEKKIYESAVRGLSSVKPPLPVKFPLPDPKDPYSLKPGSLASHPNGSRISEEEKSPSLVAAIAGARVAATQFAKNNMSPPTTGGDIESDEKPVSSRTRKNSGEGVQ